MPQSSNTDSLPLFKLPDGPNFLFEERLGTMGHWPVAGVDEAGRGPLAGPVVAAAVILDVNNIPDGINDSKKLSAGKRETIFDQIMLTSLVAWSASPAKEIDGINIRQATLAAMVRSVHSLSLVPKYVLVDGHDVPEPISGIGEALIKGDARSLSIAAASIVAKVIRDRMMVQAEIEYPGYGFAKHKGYGTKAHREAIHILGPCSLHRKSFEPVKSLLGL
ncbi:MAG: ribonuclease HII [Rhizobiaceae bacterium]